MSMASATRMKTCFSSLVRHTDLDCSLIEIFTCRYVDGRAIVVRQGWTETE